MGNKHTFVCWNELTRIEQIYAADRLVDRLLQLGNRVGGIAIPAGLYMQLDRNRRIHFHNVVPFIIDRLNVKLRCDLKTKWVLIPGLYCTVFYLSHVFEAAHHPRSNTQG